MSDSWAMDLAREEVCTNLADLSSTDSTPSSPSIDLSYRSDEVEGLEQQTTVADDGM